MIELVVVGIAIALIVGELSLLVMFAMEYNAPSTWDDTTVLDDPNVQEFRRRVQGWKDMTLWWANTTRLAAGKPRVGSLVEHWHEEHLEDEPRDID